MTADNVVNLPTPLNVLAGRIRAAYERTEHGQQEWIEGTLELAILLADARKQFSSHIAFSVWLAENELDRDRLGHQSRAALINMAKHPELARIVLQETQRTSWQLIWREEMEPRFTSASKTEPKGPPSPQPSPTSAQVPEIATSPDVKAQLVKRLDKRSGFYDAPRAEELARLFQSKGARDTLSRMWRERGGKQAWNLIVTALDAGLIVPNDAWPKEPTLLLLFPLAPVGIARQYDLMNHKQRSQIRDVLLPAMIACRDELLAEPHRLREILADYERGRQAKKHETIIAEKRSVALTSLAPTQQELVMFGHTVWPRLDLNQGDYDYDQVRAAIWTFRDYEAWNQMAKEDVESFVRRVRNSLRYLGEYLDRTERNNRMNRIFSLVVWFSHLMEKTPNGECKWPHYPHIEGQW